jgi:hypothetical protein
LKDMVLELSSMEEVEYLQTMITNHYLWRYDATL